MFKIIDVDTNTVVCYFDNLVHALQVFPLIVKRWSKSSFALVDPFGKVFEYCVDIP